MAGATNTIIQILRSDTTAIPTTLNPGEQAYSFVSDKLFIGNSNNSVITIGGQYYVDLIDGATATNTGNTIVRRDTSGNAAFTMISVSDDPSQATDVVNKSYLEGVLGGISSNTIFDGSIGSQGYSNVHTSNTYAGGSVIVVANNETVVTFTKDSATFAHDVGITGNLTVLGTTSYTNVQSLLVSNNEIVLNANATGAPLVNAYITVNRGSEDNAAIIWDETAHIWRVDDGDGVIHDIFNTGGGQSVANTTTFDSISVTNNLHAGVLEVSGLSYVSSLTANSAITSNTLQVLTSALVDSLTSNTSVTANTLEVLTSANVGSLYINGTQVLGTGFALPVTFGGTGLQSVTANTVLFGNGTGALGETNAPSPGDVLQYRTDGVKFGGIDGGTF